MVGLRRVQAAFMNGAATQSAAVFSSIASLLGAAGQANYAAANGALDRWSAASQGTGAPTVSVQWGAWGGPGVGGMAAADVGGVLGRMRRLGFGVLSPDAGLRALQAMMSSFSSAVAIPSVVAVSPFDAVQISKASAGSPIGVIFADLCAAAAAAAAAPAPAGAAPAQRYAGHNAPAVQTQAQVAADVKRVVSELAESFCGHKVEAEETLLSAGLDSLGAVELSNALVSRLAVKLPGTLIFDYPTVDSIAEYVATLVKPAPVPQQQQQQQQYSSFRGDGGEGGRNWSTAQYAAQPAAPPPHPFSDPAECLRRVADIVEGLLGSTPGAEQPLLDAGLDSLSAVELRNVLAVEAGVSMPATVIFDYPCVSDLAMYITSVVPAPAAAQMPAAQAQYNPFAHGLAAAATERQFRRRNAMAVASTAGLPPSGEGGSGGGGGDAIARTPMSRWHLDDGVVDGAFLRPRFSAFVADAECFDAATFDISAPELALMDAQQRLLLVSTTDSLRAAAGFMTGVHTKFPIGVYVGISSMDHQKLSEKRQSALSPFTATGGALSVAAGRISFAHGLTGAAIAVDTACSSSLVAMQVAVAAPRDVPNPQGGALVAGVNLLQVPETTMMFQRAGMITPDGRCKTLDAAADGYVRGEACGSVMLLDLDVVFASGAGTGAGAGAGDGAFPAEVIGAFVNQDGRSSTLTAPNGPAQQTAMRGAIATAQGNGGDIGDIGTVQMHGTGTPLGDPIEVGAIAAVFDHAAGAAGGFGTLSLGAPKSSMGHSEPAAGISSMIRAVGVLQRAAVPPVLHLTALNEHIITIQSMRAPGLVRLLADRVAKAPTTRTAGATAGGGGVGAVSISAFAFQGTNAHAIVAGSGSGSGGRGRTPDSGMTLWDAKRLWIAPPSHPMLSSFSAPLESSSTLAASSIIFIHAHIGAAASQAYLWDHRVSGRALFPAAGFMELATAAARATCASGAAALTGVAIPSPLLMGSAATGGGGDAIDIVCEIGMSGEFVIRTAAGVNARATCAATHAPKTVTAVAAARAAGASSGRSRRLARAAAIAGTPPAAEDTFVGRLASDRMERGGENAALWMPPAVLDANLQLGGARRVSASTSDVYIPSSVRGYAAPAAPLPAAEMIGVARMHAAGAHSGGGGTLSSSHAVVTDTGLGLSALSGMEMKQVKRGKLGASVTAGAAAGATRRVMAPLYDVTFAATASPPATTDVDATTRYAIDSVGSRVAAPHSGARRAATAALEGVQQLSSSTSGAARGVHAVTSHGSGALRQSALQGVVHCAAEELASSPVDIKSAVSDANGLLPGRGGLLPAAADTYGTSLVAGVMRVARLTPSTAGAAAAPHVSAQGSEASRAETLTGYVRQVMSKQAHERGVGVGVSFAGMLMQRPSEPSSRDMTSALITGGLGILGQLVGGWVASTTGASEVTLSGRSGRVSGIAATLLSGCLVHMTRCDVASTEEAGAALKQSKENLAVLHAGGVLRDATVSKQTSGSMAASMAPKSTGLFRMHASSFANAAHSTTLFSSISALLGSGGQANYVAANAWLDAWARGATAAGRAATSVQWGAWGGGGGMAAAGGGGVLARMERLGIGVLSPADGLRALRALMLPQHASVGRSVVLVNSFDWHRFLGRSGAGARRAHTGFFAEFRDLAEAKETQLVSSSSSSVDNVSHSAAAAAAAVVSAASVAAAAAALEGEIAAAVQGVIGRSVDRNEPLVDAGVDSLGGAGRTAPAMSACAF